MTSEELLYKYRIRHVSNDYSVNNMRVNRLFGLKILIEENLHPETIMCEIGSYEGISSELFAFCVKTIYCVDVFCELEYEKNFDEMNKRNKNVIKVKNNSENASKLFEDHFFDFVYIDADHSYQNIKNDITFWKNKVKIGGFLGGHDYHDKDNCGVIKAVQDFFKPDKIKIYEDSSWIVKIV